MPGLQQIHTFSDFNICIFHIDDVDPQMLFMNTSGSVLLSVLSSSNKEQHESFDLISFEIIKNPEEEQKQKCAKTNTNLSSCANLGEV